MDRPALVTCRRGKSGPSGILRHAKQSFFRRLRRLTPLCSALPFLALVAFMLVRFEYAPGRHSNTSSDDSAGLTEPCLTAVPPGGGGGGAGKPEAAPAVVDMGFTVPPELEKYLAEAPRGNASGNYSARVLTVGEITDLIRLSNAAQVIHNEDSFGPVDNSTLVIVVQVHSRVEYLKHLVISLAFAQGIEDTLVIFSHDLFDNEINELISRIDFCRYAQIFFPFSIQTHPDEFPGSDPRDCPPNMKRAEADKLGCKNSGWPDKYGHYRLASLSQIKHHWWWKAGYLFEGGFKALEGFTGDMIFLEEDHWVVKDFIHMYRLVKAGSKTHCPECAIISLGNQVKKQDRSGIQVEITQWIASKHNMGMAFGRKAWNLVKGCARQFCLFDDYNWDWSLMYIGMTCTRPNLLTLSLKSSRVFHVGECGIHHKKSSCDVRPVLKQVNEQVRSYAQLFPKTLNFRRAAYKVKAPNGNGGWGDYRDRALCLNLTLGNSV